ncbi:hypothetical protein LJC60_10250, partial [Ruminococcaceae bacterium OttesenSCG-928-D13]|nr:hypothetical protein [Ruminococcaceae bacterium OttesenSCG-928-D13]
YPGDGIGEVFLGKLMFDAVVGGMKRLRKRGSGTVLDGIREVMQDKSEMNEQKKGQMLLSAQKARCDSDNRPLYYTEWNCNAILGSASSDTRKTACFLVKAISEMAPYVTGSSIWAFSDIFDEFMIVPEEFSGGFGLLTLSGIPKPQFHALKLMSATGPRQYDLPITNDEVEISAYESDSQKHLFVYRQRMKNVQEPPESYTVIFELSTQPKNITLYRIDECHCNPLVEWEAMGSPVGLNRIEVETIMANTALVAEEVDSSYKDGKLRLQSELGVNDIHCYVIDLGSK